MMSSFEKALQILNSDESMALNLAKVENKTTWQAGEIMGKSHYKYIEILQRATEYIKVFMKHYEHYEKFFPDEVELNPDFKYYLNEVILQRKKPVEAYKNHPSAKFRSRNSREALIGRELLKLRSSNNAHEQYFYHLIMTFDRWNNHRILPTAYQEPHAFKRRQKNRHRKILSVTFNVPKEVLQGLEKEFSLGKVAEASSGDKVYYTYLSESIRNGVYKLVKIKKIPEAIEAFTKQRIYVFKQSEDVAAFTTACYEYTIDNRDKMKSGLKFWPIFRLLIKKAVNFNQMERVTPEREEYLNTSHSTEARKIEIRREKKAKARIKKMGGLIID
jgi:hypothetical protein